MNPGDTDPTAGTATDEIAYFAYAALQCFSPILKILLIYIVIFEVMF